MNTWKILGSGQPVLMAYWNFETSKGGDENPITESSPINTATIRTYSSMDNNGYTVL